MDDSKKPKPLYPKWKLLDKAERKYERQKRAHMGDAFSRLKELAAEGIISFCVKALRFKPTEYQQKFLLDHKQFIVLGWCRQSGKSHSVSGRLLHTAVDVDGCQIGVVGRIPYPRAQP